MPDPIAAQRRAMKLSLATGVAMLAGKSGAYVLTGSAAIFSDAIESVVHVIAVSFAAFSLWLGSRPASHRFQYGYERVSFFSAAFEGAMIVLAAVSIIVAAVQKWLAGIPLENLGAGMLIVVAAGSVNGLLGWYLIRTGRRTHSLILEANGRHVLTDSWTSAGVVLGLLLVMFTGWRPFDPLCAIAVALNILWSGGRLINQAISGLMDCADPALTSRIHAHLDDICRDLGVSYHGMRYRNTGGRVLIEVHLLFSYSKPLGEAHRLATELEVRLESVLGMPAEVVTHLEAVEDHGSVHLTRQQSRE